MIKRIPVDKLSVGMYVSDLDCHWLNHPFLSNHVHIADQDIIDKIKKVGLKNVYIDTEKGIDVADGMSVEEVRNEVNFRRDEIARTVAPLKSAYSIKDEMSNATRVYRDAHKHIHNLLVDVRLGRQLDLERIEPIIERMTESIFRNRDALITVSRMKQKDEYTFMHSVSVSVLMMSFARQIGLNCAEIKQIGLGGILHDVGKMKIPVAILNKPGRLTDDEYEEMKRHVEYGCEIVDKIVGVADSALEIIAQHHERVDGTGYPHKLIESNMSTVGKMVSIVDVYDALTSTRVYKQAWTPSDVLRKLIEWSKHHFNEELVHHFVRCVGIYPVGTLVQLNDGKLAVVLEQSDQHLLQPKIRVIFDIKSNVPVPMFDIDLSDSVQSAGRHILHHVDPSHYTFNPIDFLH